MPHFVATLVRHLRSRLVYMTVFAGCVRCRSLHQSVKHGAAPLGLIVVLTNLIAGRYHIHFAKIFNGQFGLNYNAITATYIL